MWVSQYVYVSLSIWETHIHLWPMWVSSVTIGNDFATDFWDT